MPWQEYGPMDERLKFIARLLDGEKMATHDIPDLKVEPDNNNSTKKKYRRRPAAAAPRSRPVQVGHRQSSPSPLSRARARPERNLTEKRTLKLARCPWRSDYQTANHVQHCL
jgi:hypothetical protein